MKTSHILSVTVLAASLCGTTSAFAQVVMDGSLGRAGALAGPNYAITSDLGQQNGANLFHSFSTFNLANGESALFSGPASVHNIISRVTGGSSSSIDGTLKSSISGANLYLINPSGILFGPNAKLDVTGSFSATTADYIKLGLNGRLDATNPGGSVLTVDPSAAFGFTAAHNPRNISIQGSTLTVSPNNSLSLIGGDIVVDGGEVKAPGGQLTLASVGSAGEVIPTGTGPTMNAFSALGDIDLLNGALISVSEGGAGTVFARGNRFFIDNDSTVGANSRGSGSGGGVDVRLSGDLILSNNGAIYSVTNAAGSGRKVVIDVENLQLINGGEINGATVGTGKGADIDILARDSITIANDGMINAYTLGSGRAGHVAVNGSRLELSSGGSIDVSSYASGLGGDLVLDVRETIQISGKGVYRSGLYGTSSQGSGGLISLVAPFLTVTDNGVITGDLIAEATTSSHGTTINLNVGNLEVTTGGSININNFGVGQAGDLVVNASDSVLLSGHKNNISSGLYSQSQDKGSGGNISISARNVSIVDGGLISSHSYGAGNGGDITIDVANLNILANGGDLMSLGAGISSGTHNSGNSGNVNIAASGSVSLDGDSGLFGSTICSNTASSSVGAGDAGDITIGTPILTLKNHGVISSSSEAGKSGSIFLDVGQLNVSGGEISTSTLGSGLAGEITIAAGDSITLAGNLAGTSPFDKVSQIDSLTMSSGNAGRVTITTPTMTIGKGGRIAVTTESGNTPQTGDGGDIIIETGQLMMSGGQLSAYTKTNGKGGKIYLSTPALSLDNTAKITTSTGGTGDGGTMTLNVDSLLLQGNSTITSESTGTGKAGDILVNAKDSLKLRDSSITAATVNADGGNIRIDPVLVDLFNSSITATVKGGTGNGGNIDIFGNSVVVDHSQVIANAEGGNGGNININSKVFLTSPESRVEASSRFGLQGNVEITAPAIDVSGSLVNLPSAFLNINDLAPKRCAFREEEISTFTVTSEGIPPRPDQAYLSR